MDLMQKLIRLLQDDYKVGAEMHSGRPLVYLNPNEIDEDRFKKDKAAGRKDAAASQLAKQLDTQYPGLSNKFAPEELIGLTEASLERGPAAGRLDKPDSLICVMNEAKGDQIKVGKIYDTFEFTEKFNPAHLLALPGSNGDWAQMVGEHEGQHCNQEGPNSTDSVIQVNVKTLAGEVDSDRAALETLRKSGNSEMIAAWTGIRAIAAANGDYKHATSIFLNSPDAETITIEHYSAAEKFKNEMNLGVAESLGITTSQAEKLRTEDPQKYAKVTQDALQKGIIPVMRDVKEDEIRTMVAKDLGLSEDQAYKLSDLKSSDVVASYQKLKAAGSFRNRGEENPHVNTYIQSYVDATKVLFVKDTTPEASATPAEVKKEKTKKEVPVVEQTAEEIAEGKKSDLIWDAEHQADSTMDEIVQKALGLTEDDLMDLQEKDPDKYYDTFEQQLKAGKVSFQTTTALPQEQIDAMIAAKIGVPVSELKDQPYFLRKAVDKDLRREGLTGVKEDNPYLKEQLELKVQKYRQEKLDAAEAAPSDEPVTPEPETETPAESASPATLSNAGKYSYLMSSRPDDGKGIPQVDLRSDDKGQMKIGCLSACEYFATKADPVLAAQSAQPAQGVEISDPALKQKVASNATSYLSMANGLA